MSTEWIAASMVGALADSAAGFLLAPGPRAESVGAVSPGLVAERFAPTDPITVEDAARAVQAATSQAGIDGKQDPAHAPQHSGATRCERQAE